ncbi:MAG: hypothetical protein R3Y26_07260 [Rikenellaceae bacterium]
MKKVTKYFLIFFLIISTSYVSYSQARQGGARVPNNKGLQQMQMNVIIKHLQLNETKTKQFTEIYTEYSKKLDDLRPDHKQNTHKREETPTDEQIEAQILESFVITEKTTDLKREYFYKFKKILSLQQIMEMYNVERQVSERIRSEFQRRNNQGGGMNK